MYRVLSWALLLCLLVGGCAGPVLPLPVKSAVRTTAAEDAALSELRVCWQELEQREVTPERRAELTQRYNALLLEVIRRYRYTLLRGKTQDIPEPAFEVLYAEQLSYEAACRAYDDFVPAADVRFENLENHYVIPGLGVPLVGIIPAEKVSNTDRRFAVQSRGAVSSITALMEFPRGARPRLHLLLRTRRDRFGRHPLAGDFSAAIELYGRMAGLKKGRFLGLLRPAELQERDMTGLSCMDSYDATKIPVILTHGLLSSASTFDNLVNRLMADPEIRRHYQFWFYNYPTGVSWIQSAADYRRALQEAVDTTDPQHRNRNWQRKVLVGHSMGGLITHYSQCEQPWLLLRNSGSLRQEKIAGYMDARYVHTPFAEADLEPFRAQYFFEPVSAGMVVYLATPHRGAPLARYRITRAFTHLIKLPQHVVNEALNLVTLREDLFIFNPSQLTDWFTSVNQLSPSGYSIRGLQGLSVRPVLTHSVIGNNGEQGAKEESSDGVVPYWSSHISWGDEAIVPASHSVQEAPETAEHLRSFLRAYAEKH